MIFNVKRIVNYIKKYCIGKLYKMEYLPYDRKLVYSKSDFVRTGCLELMAYEINSKNVIGDVAELGVYKGQFACVINAVFPNRNLYLFDTFTGFDKKDAQFDKNQGFSTGNQDFADTSVEKVLLQMPHKEKCIIRKGWFPNTTKGLENNKFVFVSLDADLFEPIYAGLSWFYPRLEWGGVIFIHDFNNRGYMGCRKAVLKYCEEKGISYLCIPDIAGTAVIVK